MTDTVFDVGIDTLYQFYDKQSKEYRFVLQRAKEILRIPISTTNKNELVEYLDDVITDNFETPSQSLYRQKLLFQ